MILLRQKFHHHQQKKMTKYKSRIDKLFEKTLSSIEYEVDRNNYPSAISLNTLEEYLTKITKQTIIRVV